jgi:proteasome lid subunit RPN8/RPN11
MTVRISRSTRVTIAAQAAAAAPREACGLLFGTHDAVTGMQAAQNVAEDPEGFFEIDPATLFAALRAERAGGPAILGYWHSHPSGDAMPSAVDAAMAVADGKLWLIVAAEAFTLWRAGSSGMHDRFEAVAIDWGDDR